MVATDFEEEILKVESDFEVDICILLIYMIGLGYSPYNNHMVLETKT